MMESSRLDARSVAVGILLVVAVLLIRDLLARAIEWIQHDRTRFRRQEDLLSSFVAAHDSIINFATSLAGQNHYGLMVVSGVDLEIRYMDKAMQRISRRTWTPEDRIRVEEFLPEAMRLQHGKWMRAASEKGALPGSLIHPLRNVELLMGDGKYLKCHVSIGALADSTTNKEAETFEQTDSWKSGLNFLYGESVGQTIADGETPKQERYDNATVLFLDIVDFTKNCMRRKPDEVAVWMSKIHGTIEPLINKYCVRKIETRGDCYLVVAGTNVGSGDHSYDQVTRMVRFASEVSNNLRVLHNTFIRVGVASGPITIDYITTHVFAPVVTVYGETVCLAARMEQSGEPSLVHLSESSTAQLCREFDDDIKHTLMDKMEIKSQGAIATSWFSCTERCFTDRVGRPLQFPQHVSVDCVNFRLSEYKPDPNWSPVAVTRGAADAELESGGTSALRLRDSKRRSVPENLPTNSHSPVRSTSGGSWSPVDMANNLREKLMAGSNVGRRDSWASSPGRAVSGLFSRAGSN